MIIDRDAPGLAVHDKAYHVDRTRVLNLPIGGATPGGSGVATSADLALRGSNTRYRAWAFDGGGTTAEGITLEFIVPSDYVSNGTFQLAWTNLGAGSGTVAWQLLGSSRAAADNLDGSTEFLGTDTLSAPAQNVLALTAHVPNTSFAPGEMVLLQVVRVPASDTLGNDAGLLSLAFVYTADM